LPLSPERFSSSLSLRSAAPDPLLGAEADINVYKLTATTDVFASITTESGADWDRIRQVDGRPLKDHWSPIRLQWIKRLEDGTPLRSTDFPWLASHVPIFSERAVEALRSLLRESGELLELDCEGERLLALNVMRFVDALDVSASKITYFADGKKVMDIRSYAFRRDALLSVPLFKLPQTPLGHVFVTDPFVAAVEGAELVGFQFDPVWESPDLV
jgi:hypothetical protein